MSTFSQRLPDLSSLLQQRAALQRGSEGLLAALGSMGAGDEGSPIAVVTGAFGRLRVTLDINVGALASELPAAIETARQAVPAGGVEFVAGVAEGYETARRLLADGDLARAAASGDLQSAALGVIAEALGLFEGRVAELTGGLLDAGALAELAAALAAIERFRADFPAARDELPPFLARFLVGVGHDLLGQPLASARALLAALAAAGPQAVDALVADAAAALAQAEGELHAAIEGLDPASEPGYARVTAALDAYEAAYDALFDALEAAYGAALAALGGDAWGEALGAYGAALAAVPLDRVPTLDDVIESIGAALDDLLARAAMLLGPEEAAERLAALTGTMRDAFMSSSLGQVRQAIAGFLDGVRELVEQIPTEQIQEAVGQMLGRVGQELDSLGIDRAADLIADAFAEADRLIGETLGGDMVGQVRAELRGLVEQARGLPLAQLAANLEGALAQLGGLIAQIEQEVAALVDELQGLLAQLDDVSFTPVGDAVVGEIDAIKARLAQINPNALSDAERLALRGALALITAIDLKGQIAAGVKPAFHALKDEAAQLLGSITEAFSSLCDQAGIFSPEALLQPVDALFAAANDAVGRLNGRIVLGPVYAEVEELAGRLGAISPARLLDPLQGPYDEMMLALAGLDPSRWLEPINQLYAELDRLVSIVDITPLLDELERRRRQIFSDARAALLGALDAADLPAPVASLVARLRPLLDGFTEAIFGDPDGELRRIAVDVGGGLRLSDLFAPLDEVFDELTHLVAEAPADELTAVFEGLRLGLGAGLDELDPTRLAGRLRALRGALADRSPALVGRAPIALPALRAIFELKVAAAPAGRPDLATAVGLRFEAVARVVIPAAPGSRAAALETQHQALLAGLAGRAAEIERSEAAAHYGPLRANLARLLPDFLRAPAPLSHADILAGLEAMRPTARAARLDTSLERFAARVAPLAEGMGELINGFFSTLREVIDLLNPLALRDHVAAVYTAIRGRLRLIDPAAIGGQLREQIIEPLLAPLEAINPTLLRERLQALFDKLLATLSGAAAGLLDELALALDEALREVRAVFAGLSAQVRAVLAQAVEAVGSVLEQIEGLVFVEVLERLRRVLDNLGASFDQELDRVLSAFEAMLQAIPLGEEGPVSVSVSVI